MTRTILKTIPLSKYDLILIPGFAQWDTKSLEKELSVNIRKGPEFASELPTILRNIKNT